MGATGLGGTFEDLDGTEVVVTTAEAVPVYGRVELTMRSPSSGSAVVAFRVVEVGSSTSGLANQVNLSNNNDVESVTAFVLTGNVPAGARTLRAQWRRVSGSGTVESTRKAMFGQGQQGAVGPLLVPDPELLKFGGSSASYPGLKRSGDTIQARLADDSALAAAEFSEVKVDGNRVVGPRGAAISSAGSVSGTATVEGVGFSNATEFNNFVSGVNSAISTLNHVLNRLRATGGHGLIDD